MKKVTMMKTFDSDADMLDYIETIALQIKELRKEIQHIRNRAGKQHDSDHKTEGKLKNFNKIKEITKGIK